MTMYSTIVKSVLYAGLSLNVILFSLAIGFAIFYIYFYRMRKNDNSANDQLLEELLEKFTPEPLVENDNESENVLHVQPTVVTKIIGTKININDKECINFGCDNFYNLIENNRISEQATSTIQKYGVGSCGPRGFYGTVDVHLDLEERIAKFMNMEEAVVYSYWFSTISSAIPAYCKRNDVIFCDEMISFAARKGMDAAKCTVVYFKHNDVQDLENKIQAFNKETASKRSQPRKFLVLEGIYHNTGNICNLPPIVELRSKYKMRLFLDESLTIGILGNTGRGCIEHFGIDPTEIDMIIGSLENWVGSVGGFCVGTHFIIEHQRLSGLGYCFSASLPPVLARAANCAFDYLDEKVPELCSDLREKCLQIHEKLKTMPNMQLIGHAWSPIKFLRLVDYTGESCNEFEVYDRFAQICQQNGVAVRPIKNKANEQYQIKVCVNIDFTEDDINKGIDIMRTAASECMC